MHAYTKNRGSISLETVTCKQRSNKIKMTKQIYERKSLQKYHWIHFFTGHLLLGMGTTLKCHFYSSETLLRRTHFPFGNRCQLMGSCVHFPFSLLRPCLSQAFYCCSWTPWPKNATPLEPSSRTLLPWHFSQVIKIFRMEVLTFTETGNLFGETTYIRETLSW